MKLDRIVVPKSIGAVVVVDAQNTFMDERGPFGKNGGTTKIRGAWGNGIMPLLERARGSNDKNVVLNLGWTQARYKHNQFDGFPLLGESGPHVTNPYSGENDPEWQVRIRDNANRDGEPVFLKDNNKPFEYQGKPNGLEVWLDPTELIVTVGFTTTSCVDEFVKALVNTKRTAIVPMDCTSGRDNQGEKVAMVFGTWEVHERVIVVSSWRDITFAE